MITPSEINSFLGYGPDVRDVGVEKVFQYLDRFVNTVNMNHIGHDTYIVCIDSVFDNTEVATTVSKIYNIVGKTPNFHIVEYICFEQLIVSSPNVLDFFPALLHISEYTLLKQHADLYGLGHSRALEIKLKKYNIKDTTERTYVKVLEKAVISSTARIGNRNYITAFHHYILKGKWSACWTMDCTQECPDDKCWEKTGDHSMCTDCSSELKGQSRSCIYSDVGVTRKYAEEKECHKKLPTALSERLRMMFDAAPIREIDTY